MPTSAQLNQHPSFASFVWNLIDVLRDSYARSEYPKVILPFTMLRRLDCAGALAAGGTGAASASRSEPISASLEGTPPSVFAAGLAHPSALADTLKRALSCLDPAMAEVLALLDVEGTIDALEGLGLLFHVVRACCRIDLSPRLVSNHAMGTLFEEVVRTCVEHPGEHYTPRDVVRVSAALLLAQEGRSGAPAGPRAIYDPCCGTGGFLTGLASSIEERGLLWPPVLYGQELNAMSYAICKADLLLSGRGGEGAHIALGNTLSQPAHRDLAFDLMACNPPYGLAWHTARRAVEREARSAQGGGRFGAGLPPVSDGQLLFLMDLLSHARPPDVGNGSRMAIILSASALFRGESGGGESEIRRAILERDLLEAIVALPELLFYNTGIGTFVWLLTTKKERHRRGRVQLIDARQDFVPLRRGVGEKRREISEQQVAAIVARYLACEEGPNSRVLATTDFGYRAVTIERPLRLNFQASPERIGTLEQQGAFTRLVERGGKGGAPAQLVAEEERGGDTGKQGRQEVLALLAGLPPTRYRSRAPFAALVQRAAQDAGLHLSLTLLRVIIDGLAERDEGAEICRDERGNPVPDPLLRDSERVELDEAVPAFFAREVLPYVPDAWINTAVRDGRDGGIGKVGYEIAFARSFFHYQPPRPLEEIEADILAVERESRALFKELFGDLPA